MRGGDRVKCASSCAPSGEVYKATVCHRVPRLSQDPKSIQRAGFLCFPSSTVIILIMLAPFVTLALAAIASAALPCPRHSCNLLQRCLMSSGLEAQRKTWAMAAPLPSSMASSPPSPAQARSHWITPLSWLDPLYPSSVTDGINAMISLIQNYVNSCGGKIVLVGFSQGANVITDVLAGGVDKPTPLGCQICRL